MKNTLIISICALMLVSCGTVKEAGNNIADSLNQTNLSSKIGENYKDEASKYRLSKEIPPRKIYYMGELVNKEPLKNGDTIYIHRQEQETGSDSSGFFNVFSENRDVRYDMSAYLVGANGIIKDWGHGRYNTTRACNVILIGDDDDHISSENCTKEEFNQELTQSKNLITTSTGQPINVWRN